MKGYVFAVLAAISFSLTGIFIKFIGNGIPIMTLSFLRAFLTLVFLAFIVPLLDKNFLKQSKKDILVYAGLGFLIGLSQLIHNASFLVAPVSNIVLIFSVWVVLAALFAFIVLKEKLSKFEAIAFAVSLLGLAIINPLASEYFTGNMLAVLSAATWALIVVLMRFEDRNHAVGTIFWIFLFASLTLSPAIFIQGFGDLAQNILGVLGLGLSTGLAYFFITLALEKIDTDHYAIISLIVGSVSAITLAVLLLNESLTPQIIIGGFLLLLAGLIIKAKEKLT